MNWIKRIPQLIPLLPILISLITKLVGVFTKKHDPSVIDKTTAEEVQILADEAAALGKKEEAEWNIVKGED